MNLVITTTDGEFYTVAAAGDMELENLFVLVSLESGKPPDQIQLSRNGVPLVDRKAPLSRYGCTDGDMLLMTLAVPRSAAATTMIGVTSSSSTPGGGGTRLGGTGIDWAAIRVPGMQGAPAPAPVAARDECEELRQQILADPYQLAVLRERDQTFANAINDREAFAKVYKDRQELIRKRKREEQFLLTGNPMDPEYQRMLLEKLQGKQIEENLEQAFEEHPESFGQVIMLYIDVEINGHKVKAFVDSGAQMTLISSSCAEKCNVSRLIDKRFQGVAKGVGTQKILGRVHLLPLKIGSDHFPCTFSVLEDQPMDMLLGLDMLKRHQCIIDLKENCLKIGTTGTAAPFLAERDIPKEATAAGASAPSQSSSGGTSTAAATPPSAASDESVSKLVEMGFTADQARKALLQCSNNVDLAASLLFERGGQL